jgi:hypothetical protein
MCFNTFLSHVVSEQCPADSSIERFHSGQKTIDVAFEEPIALSSLSAIERRFSGL